MHCDLTLLKQTNKLKKTLSGYILVAVIVIEDPVIYLCIPAGVAITRSASASQNVTGYVPSEMLDERLTYLPQNLLKSRSRNRAKDWSILNKTLNISNMTHVH